MIHRSFDYASMRSQIVEDRVDDLTLFYNTLFMRLHPICFMENLNLDVSLDINLFCIN